MKRKNIFPDQKQKKPDDLQPTAIAELVPAKTGFTPTPAAVAKKAYFSYLNGGSQPGQEVKHWLEAEAQLFGGVERESQIHPGSSLFVTEH
jgi:hypothetical protein